jgi:hypothetical protein
MSLLKLDSIQLGRNADPTKNMAWRQAALGDFRLSVGNATSPISDVITATATGLTLLNPSAVASPASNDNTNTLAPTGWVRNYVTGLFASPSRTVALSLTDNSTQLTSSAWVNSLIASKIPYTGAISTIYSSTNTSATDLEQQTISDGGTGFIVLNIHQLNNGTSVLTVGQLTAAGVYTLWASLTDATNKILTARMCYINSGSVYLAYIRNGVNIPIIFGTVTASGFTQLTSIPLQNASQAAVKLDISNSNGGSTVGILYYQTNTDAYYGVITSNVYAFKATIAKPANSTFNCVRISKANYISVFLGTRVTGVANLKARVIAGDVDLVNGVLNSYQTFIDSTVSTLNTTDIVWINDISIYNGSINTVAFVVNASDNRTELIAANVSLGSTFERVELLTNIKELDSTSIIRYVGITKFLNNTYTLTYSYENNAGGASSGVLISYGVLSKSGYRKIDKYQIAIYSKIGLDILSDLTDTTKYSIFTSGAPYTGCYYRGYGLTLSQ